MFYTHVEPRCCNRWSFFSFCLFDTQKPRWWVSVGCLRWRCSGPHLAIGRRADAKYRFRGVWSQKVRKVNFFPWTRLFMISRCSIHNNLTAPPFILIYLDPFLGNAIVVPLSSAAFALRGRRLSPLFFFDSMMNRCDAFAPVRSWMLWMVVS